ncbi:MAG TPA: glycine cleavage system aminomethyltransferase GcvT [Candidatus Limnocylindrales bacterium]|nr:glycine cleavage system aminomethyltransferase GcvT [Candidatus Limnocylindrales bacterium]
MTPGGAAEMDMTAAPPNVTPLLEAHRALGAKLIEFGGWLMPVQYSGILEEHRAVRERVGLFDLSHMGELWLEGPEAAAALARAVVSDPTRLAPGRAQYSMLCATDGGVIDDLIIYRVAEERFLVVANAANARVVSDELAGRTAGARAVLDDRALATALCALQGPRSVDVLAPLTALDLAAIRYYGIAEGEVAGIPALVARTGYTGEDGFEIFVDVGQAPALWEALLRSGEPHGLAPVGLGARDTLRLEAGMPLYGQELTRETTPYDAGLGRVVRLDKDGEFVGRAALERVEREGPSRRLVGLELQERGIARTGYPVLVGERRTGAVTSGTMSPTLGRAIAMAYVAPADGEIGTMLAVEIRGAPVAATVVPLPFYRRAS